jgi:hypothetical protein
MELCSGIVLPSLYAHHSRESPHLLTPYHSAIEKETLTAENILLSFIKPEISRKIRLSKAEVAYDTI